MPCHQIQSFMKKPPTNFMISIGFKQNAIDPCLYQRQLEEADGTITYVLNYVDDAIIFNKRLAHVEKLKNELSERFKITTAPTSRCRDI